MPVRLARDGLAVMWTRTHALGGQYHDPVTQVQVCLFFSERLTYTLPRRRAAAARRPLTEAATVTPCTGDQIGGDASGGDSAPAAGSLIGPGRAIRSLLAMP